MQRCPECRSMLHVMLAHVRVAVCGDACRVAISRLSTLLQDALIGVFISNCGALNNRGEVLEKLIQVQQENSTAAMHRSRCCPAGIATAFSVVLHGTLGFRICTMFLHLCSCCPARCTRMASARTTATKARSPGTSTAICASARMCVPAVPAATPTTSRLALPPL